MISLLLISNFPFSLKFLSWNSILFIYFFIFLILKCFFSCPWCCCLCICSLNGVSDRGNHLEVSSCQDIWGEGGVRGGGWNRVTIGVVLNSYSLANAVTLTRSIERDTYDVTFHPLSLSLSYRNRANPLSSFQQENPLDIIRYIFFNSFC